MCFFECFSFIWGRLSGVNDVVHDRLTFPFKVEERQESMRQ